MAVVGVRAAVVYLGSGGGTDIIVSIDNPGMISSTSMASSVVERLRAEVARTGALPLPLSVVGPMLFKKSSTVFVGTVSVPSAACGPWAAGVAAETPCFFRDAMTALRANSSCLRCCSISTRLGETVEDEAKPGTKVAAVADNVPWPLASTTTNQQGNIITEMIPHTGTTIGRAQRHRVKSSHYVTRGCCSKFCWHRWIWWDASCIEVGRET